MAPLSDPIIIKKIHSALSNWQYTGYVIWKPIARSWVEKNLQGMTTRAVAEIIFQHVDSGGEIDQVNESRSEWSGQRFHYDFRIPVEGRLIYIETVLMENDPEDPVIRVVSIHEV
jgi:hypothetical protein